MLGTTTELLLRMCGKTFSGKIAPKVKINVREILIISINILKSTIGANIKSHDGIFLKAYLLDSPDKEPRHRSY
jgi:hypothetical protein